MTSFQTWTAANTAHGVFPRAGAQRDLLEIDVSLFAELLRYVPEDRLTLMLLQDRCRGDAERAIKQEILNR